LEEVMGLFRQKKKTTDAGEKAEKADADIPPTLMSVLKSVQEMDRKPPVTLALMGPFGNFSYLDKTLRRK
ncbi:hypothetical protein JG687_00018435, partial [Phytophthora cactorum]